MPLTVRLALSSLSNQCGACRDRGEAGLCEWAEGVKPQSVLLLSRATHSTDMLLMLYILIPGRVAATFLTHEMSQID